MSDAPATRRPRADALRNRQLIIEAATDSFRDHGLEVSVAEIARRAGVGTGTLFRNFPTKQDLIRAIVESRLLRWQEVVRESISAPDIEQAFGEFIDEVLRFSYYDKGQMEAFRERILDEPELLDCKMQAFDLTGTLLDKAKEAGLLREELSTEDFYSLTAGFTESARIAAGDEETTDGDPALRYREILLDALRPRS